MIKVIKLKLKATSHFVTIRMSFWLYLRKEISIPRQRLHKVLKKLKIIFYQTIFIFCMQNIQCKGILCAES